MDDFKRLTEQLLKFYINTESVDDTGFENFFDDNIRNLQEFLELYKFDVKQRGRIRLKIRDLRQEETGGRGSPGNQCTGYRLLSYLTSGFKDKEDRTCEKIPEKLHRCCLQTGMWQMSWKTLQIVSRCSSNRQKVRTRLCA